MVLATLALLGVVDVPGGSFAMGSGRAPDERPVRDVTLSAYRIDRAEVSLAAFEAFVAAGAYTNAAWWAPEGWAWAGEHPGGAGATIRASGRPGDHPVVAVTWWEADAYCRWKGGALPTEAQWEHAACDDGGGRYPWGDDEDFAAAWFNEGRHGQIASVKTQPVAEQDSALASPFGLVHAAGNVWEWTADSYDARWYAEAPVQDPVNTQARPWRTARGGSYANLPSYCGCTHREPVAPAEVRLTMGFRCAYPPS
ncbi:MAG: SUMF1/EgtB/PvdO family nonheme iron enzyme [Myxococcota bacterium]